MASRNFQTDGTMKLKEHFPKDFRFHLGILSHFLFEDWRQQDSSQMQKDDMVVGKSLDLVMAGNFKGSQ